MDGAAKEGELLRQALEALAPLALPLRIVRRRVAHPEGPDTELELRTGEDRVRYAVEFKRGVRPATLGAVLHQFQTMKGHPLLVTDYVTPPLADELRAREVEFIDTAGNAYLNRPPVFVFVKGQKPEPAPRHLAERGRTFQATGLRVLFALLAKPELVARPYREIAAAAGVAHGAVGWVMAELPGLGYLAELQGKRRLVNGERLLAQWTEAYARTLRPRLLLGRFRGDMIGLRTQAAELGKGILAGGEIAAAQLTGQLRPGTATLYMANLDPAALARLRLRADDAGEVDVRLRFWTFDGERPGLVPTLLVYADLLAIGDARCLEIAALLRRDLVDRLI